MMRRNPLALALVGAVILVMSAVPWRTASAGDDLEKTTLTIKGMTCGGCVAAVKVQLKKTPGVASYDVSLDRGEAEVTYDAAVTDPTKIAASVSTTGFQATVKEAGREKPTGGGQGSPAGGRS